MGTVGPAGLVTGLMTILTACAGATVGSGVGDARLERAPWYAGQNRSATAGAVAIAYVPITYQAGGEGSPGFDPEHEAGAPAATLVKAMSTYLDSLAAGRLTGPLQPPAGTPPDVQFGCDLDAVDECVIDEEGGVFGPGRARMRLAVARPSGRWTEGAAAAMAAVGAEALLVITLEVGQYWPRQTNWRGSKAVELGTDRTVALPWLTSLETPVSVLQITGALVGPDGKAIRIGAEGLRARRTPILLSGFGAQALITDEDLEALMTERLEERPDGPLVWQAALKAMVAELSLSGRAGPRAP